MAYKGDVLEANKKKKVRVKPTKSLLSRLMSLLPIDHMTSCSKLLYSYGYCADNKRLNLQMIHSRKLVRIGTIKLSSLITNPS